MIAPLLGLADMTDEELEDAITILKQRAAREGEMSSLWIVIDDAEDCLQDKLGPMERTAVERKIELELLVR
jgi:hypothetical protein